MLLVPVAHAQSTADLQSMINGLLAQIQTLQAQLAQKGGSTTPASIPSSNLTLGSKGADVSALQQILIDGGYLKISAPTGSFGPLTRAALAAWQKANNVSPASGYYGPVTRAALAASMPSTGTGSTGSTGGSTGGTVTAPASGLVVGLASDNPSAGSLISSSNSAAARVPVLAVNLTAGNSSGVTVSEIKFTKQGVLSDSSISGAYLVENGKVIAQYSSLNQGVLAFSGVNLSVAAGQTRKLWLAIDPSTGLSAGNTVSFALTNASMVSAVDASNGVVTASGNFPLNGNVFTVTSVSNPAIATFTITSTTVGNTVFAGTQDVPVSQWTVSAGNSAILLKSMNFKVTGSANKSDIKNVKLFVNGVQVGNTLPSVAADGSAYFDLTTGSTSVKVNTGSSNIQVRADVMGSPSFNFAFQLLNTFDIYAVDSQYNVPVAATINGGSGTTVTINQGQITLSLASDTPTGNIARGGSGTSLAKFTLYAAGEAIRVRWIGFSLIFTGGTGADLDSYIKNVSLTDDAGGQVGSTINSLVTSRTCNGTTAFSAATSTASNCFGDSSSPINYIVPANTTRVLTLRGDIQSGADFTTVVARLNAGTTNLQGMTSSQTNSTGQVSGSAMNLVLNTLTASTNSGVGTQTVAAGQTGAKIGSYSLTASAAEGVNINTLNITMSASGTLFSNLRLMIGNTQFGTTQPTLSASGVYGFSGTLNIPAGTSRIVDVYADVLSSISSVTYSAVTTLSGCTGQGASTFTSVSCSSVTGQNVKGAGQASVQIALDSTSPAAGQLVMGSTGNTLAVFRFSETTNVEDVKVTALNIFDQVNTTAGTLPGFTNLALYQGSTLLGTAGSASTSIATSTPGQGYYYKFNLSNPIIVPVGGSISVTLKGDVSSFAASGATDNTTHVFKIATSSDADNDTLAETVVALGRTSNATSSVSLSSANANQQRILRTKLSVTGARLGEANNRGKTAVDDIGTITFTADNAGALLLNTVTVTYSGNAPTGTAFFDSASVTLFDPDTGTSYTKAATSTTSISYNLNNYALSAGASKTFRIRINSNSASSGGTTKEATANVTHGLTALINAGTDVTYTTAVSGGTSGVTLPTSGIGAPPITLTTVSYLIGT